MHMVAAWWRPEERAPLPPEGLLYISSKDNAYASAYRDEMSPMRCTHVLSKMQHLLRITEAFVPAGILIFSRPTA